MLGGGGGGERREENGDTTTTVYENFDLITSFMHTEEITSQTD